MIRDFFTGPYFTFADRGDKHPSKDLIFSADEARKLNEQKQAVCFYVNELVGGRGNEHCKRVRAWFVDIDCKDRPKPELNELLSKSPLLPSCVVETRNGYHIYFEAKDALKADFKRQQMALVEFFGGDRKCCNLARGMRCPGFYHHKQEEPFLVSVVFEADIAYSRKTFDFAFPYVEEDEAEEKPKVKKKQGPITNIFDYIFNYNAKEILEMLSGTGYVSGKQYKFKRQSKGHYNIIVDGKDSGCFVNQAGKVIGDPEYSGGAIEWLKFYGLSRVEAAKAICEVMGWEFKQ